MERIDEWKRITHEAQRNTQAAFKLIEDFKKQLNVYETIGTAEELSQLKQEIDSGLRPLLPCKVGSYVFVSPNNGKSFHKAKLYGVNEDGAYLVRLCDYLLEENEKHLVANPLDKIFYDWFRKVYAREAAETALKECERND